jgi:pyridoxal phosphate enzyme (YggS family)
MKTRKDAIAENLQNVRRGIDEVAIAAGRVPSDITLIVVTKTYPASDIEILHSLGITNIGENRDQEARSKYPLVNAELSWHHIGQLQRNKVKSVLTWADVIHSIDRSDLVMEVGRRADRPVDIFLQVSLDSDSIGRAGALESELKRLGDTCAQFEYLRLQGLMAVAPLQVPAARAFERLREIHLKFMEDFPHASALSAGMSQDYEEAIKFGATHVRIGSSILGSRPFVR